MGNTLRELRGFGRDCARHWVDHKAPKMAAALSYYALFSMAPILIVAVAVAQIVFTKEAARAEVVLLLNNFFGSDVAHAIVVIVDNAAKDHVGILATVLGLFAIFFGATGALGELQDSLNAIWDAPREKTTGWRAYLVRQFISLSGLIGMGCLLALTLVSTTALSAAHHWLHAQHLLARRSLLWNWVNASGSLLLLVLIFAIVFKTFPRVKIAWRDVWLGAIFTAVFFTFGRILIGLYLHYSAIRSTYGAAGSLVVVLIWVYYVAQIFFFGAELTYVFAHRYGSRAEK
jgi:membrane protein